MSRDAILAAVRAHHGDPVALPRLPAPSSATQDELIARFRTRLDQVGGRWAERAPSSDLSTIVRQHYPDAERIVNTVEEPPVSTFATSRDTPPSELVQVHLAILRGRFGVAENAAIWVDADALPHRALPFVAEHLVFLLRSDDIVTDMHAAYAALEGRHSGCGVFISGPSKTADIEQSLVMGAQGPRSVVVVME